jgi:hypothetical protein
MLFIPVPAEFRIQNTEVRMAFQQLVVKASLQKNFRFKKRLASCTIFIARPFSPLRQYKNGAGRASGQ